MTEQNDTLTQNTSSQLTSSNEISSIYQNLTLLCHYVDMDVKLFLDINDNVKLFKNDVELTKHVINAKQAFAYDEDYWSYRDNDGYVHLFKNDIELTKNIKTRGITKNAISGKWMYANDKNRQVPI